MFVCCNSLLLCKSFVNAIFFHADSRIVLTVGHRNIFFFFSAGIYSIFSMQELSMYIFFFSSVLAAVFPLPQEYFPQNRKRFLKHCTKHIYAIRISLLY